MIQNLLNLGDNKMHIIYLSSLHYDKFLITSTLHIDEFFITSNELVQNLEVIFYILIGLNMSHHYTKLSSLECF